MIEKQAATTRRQGRRWSSALAGAAALLVICSCGLTGPSHAAERAEYLDALFEGDPESAYELLCERSRLEMPSPADLDAAFRAQVERFDLLGEWDPLRGDSEVAVADFLRSDSEYLTLETPLETTDDTVLMCPSPMAPLGSTAPD